MERQTTNPFTPEFSFELFGNEVPKLYRTDDSTIEKNHKKRLLNDFESNWDAMLMDSVVHGDPDLEILKHLVALMCNLSREMRIYYNDRLNNIINDVGWAFVWKKDNAKLMIVLPSLSQIYKRD